MQNLLALETSTDACSVALRCGNAVTAVHHVEPRAHNRLLLSLIDQVLAEASLVPAQLDAVAFGRGPGSFTGLRIAAAVTQGIAWAHALPVVGVSTLQVLAATALSQAETPPAGVVTLVDARMDECYWNAFCPHSEQTLQPLAEDRLARPETLPELLAPLVAQAPGDWWLVGNGSPLLPASDWPAGIHWPLMNGELLPHARALLQLAWPRLEAGEGLPADQAIPHYLRDERRWRRLEQAPG